MGFTGLPTGINNSGQVIGEANTINLVSILWNGPNNVVSLPTLGGSTEPTAINNEGQVVGSSTSTMSAFPDAGYAFLWSQGKPMENLGTLNGFSSSYATAINDSGIVVGTAVPDGLDSTLNERAFIYKNGELTISIPFRESRLDGC